MIRRPVLALAAPLLAICVAPLQADDAVTTTIGDLYQEKAAFNGKQVTVSGTVVKVNNQIMNRNFLHIQDGSGDVADGSDDLILTSHGMTERCTASYVDREPRAWERPSDHAPVVAEFDL